MGKSYDIERTDQGLDIEEASKRIDDLTETVRLLGEYGQAKFRDEWWPGNPVPYIGQDKGKRLMALLEEV